MALHSLGTNTTTSLQCLAAWSQVLAQADVAAISQALVADDSFATILSGYGFGQQAVLATATTNGNASLTSVTSSNVALPVTQIQVGDVALGIGIPAGTFVQAISGNTVTMSQAATTSSAGTRVAFVRWQADVPDFGLSLMGSITIPNRGILKILPGDYVALDNTGWPILLSGATVGYAGSQWTFS